MARIIEGQIISTTHVDSHGERITRDEMISLFNGRPPSRSLGINHNLTAAPIARAFNDRLEELADGELAWKVDVEIYDEQAAAQFGGFSIAFTRRHRRLGSGPVVAKITINSRQFDFDAIANGIQHVVPPGQTIEVVERVEKADAITLAIIGIVAFAGGQVAEGFFKAIGATIFDAVKKLHRKDEPAAPVEVHFHWHLEPERKLPVVLLAVDPACNVEDVRRVTDASIRTMITQHVSENSLERAVATIRPGGVLDLQFITGENGEVVYRKSSDGAA